MKAEDKTLELRILKTITSGKEKDSARIFSEISEDSFYWNECKEAYKRILKVLRKTSKIPSWDEICSDPKISEDTRDVLKEFDKKRVKDVDGSIAKLKSYQQLRKLIYISKTINAAVQENKVDIEELLNTVSEDLLAARSCTDRKDWFIHIGGDDGSDLQAAKDTLTLSEDFYIPTGFAGFDRDNGGMPLGTCMLIATTSGNGKSVVASKMAQSTAMFGAPTCMVPLEMEGIEMMQRQLARIGDEKMQDVINPKKMGSERRKKLYLEFKQYRDEIKKKGSLLSYYPPKEDVTIEELLYALKPFDYKVIIIDYIGLLKGLDGDDQWRAMKRVTRFCKRYALANQICIVLIAQLSEEGTLRNSKSMKDDANLMWTWQGGPNFKEDGIAWIDVEKSRNQNNKKFPVKFDWEKMDVRDLTEDEMKEVSANQKKDKKKSKDRNFFDD